MKQINEHRRIAKEAGLKRFFSGIECVNGHIAERHVSNSTCCECAKARANTFYKSLDKFDKEEYLEKQKQYNYKNRELFSAYAKRTHAERRQRVPAWSEHKEILDFYKNCPAGMVVDHKIPLKGKAVSGLHVLSNLQYLTEEQNRAKSNKFEVV